MISASAQDTIKPVLNQNDNLSKPIDEQIQQFFGNRDSLKINGAIIRDSLKLKKDSLKLNKKDKKDSLKVNNQKDSVSVKGEKQKKDSLKIKDLKKETIAVQKTEKDSSLFTSTDSVIINTKLKANIDSAAKVNHLGYFNNFQNTIAIPKIEMRSSIFENHALKASAFKVKTIPDNKSDVVSLLIFFFISVTTLFFVIQRKKMFEYFYSFFFRTQFYQTFRNETRLVTVFQSSLFLISAGILSIFIFQIFDFYKIQLNLFNIKVNYLFIFQAVLILYLIKMSITYLNGIIFKVSNEGSIQVYNQFLFLLSNSILLLPVILMYQFTKNISQEIWIILGLSIISFLLLIRVVRVWDIYRNELGLSTTYVFLYLCTHEILPLALFLKFLGK